MSDEVTDRQPADHANGVSPISGVAPPGEHRWKPGQSGNPSGRPSAGASIRDWINVMSDYTREQVENVLADPKASSAKKAAARAWLHATTERCTKLGLPIAGPDLDRIIGHTELSIAEEEKNARLDAGKATERVALVPTVLVHTAPPALEEGE